MQQLSEKEKQMMMAQMMRTGMTQGMGGQQQFMQAPPQQAPQEFEEVSMETMQYEGDTPSIADMAAAQGYTPGNPTDDNPNADILAAHGREGNSVGGGGGPSQGRPDPSMNPAMEGRQNTTTMQSPIRKKRWWE